MRHDFVEGAITLSKHFNQKLLFCFSARMYLLSNLEYFINFLKGCSKFLDTILSSEAYV